MDGIRQRHALGKFYCAVLIGIFSCFLDRNPSTSELDKKNESSDKSSATNTGSNTSKFDNESISSTQTATPTIPDSSKESVDSGSSSETSNNSSSDTSESNSDSDTTSSDPDSTDDSTSDDSDEESSSGDSSTGDDEQENRIVVIGDLHADIEVAKKAFRLAGAIDANDTWIGGSLTIVQMGDLIGRSDDDREVLDFIFDMQEKAESNNGKVHVLIGNHEVFGARLDFRYNGDDCYAAFEGIPGLELDSPRIKKLPQSQRARGAALMPGGLYSKRIASFSTILKLGETIYVHGGVVPRWANYGIKKINQEVSNWFLGIGQQPDSTKGYDGGDRVMWTRQFSSGVNQQDCEVLQESLQILGAKRMIVAHTVHRKITSKCNEQVWAVDVGMSRYFDGNMELLEILDDDFISIIRP